MENVKKVYLRKGEDFENCYIFSPAISSTKVINGKTYIIKRYFNGSRNFSKSINQLAINNCYKKEQ